MGFYETILNTDPLFMVVVIALVVNLASTVIYKYTTNQKRIRELKKKQKEFQKEIRSLQKSHPDKAMKKQKEMMGMNGELMKSSMKPMLYTMLPLLLLFGWISGSLMYEPIIPNEQFTVTANFAKGAVGDVTLTTFPELTIDTATKNVSEETVWKLSGPEGRYQLTINVGEAQWNTPVIISNDRKYESPESRHDGILETITVSNEYVRPFGGIEFFGWKPSMIGAYIILSIAFSLLIRRLFKVA